MKKTSLAQAVFSGLLLILAIAMPTSIVLAGTSPNDEIHSSYGDSPSEMWVYWRGTDTVLYYGLDETYGLAASANPSVVMPVDIEGPFYQVKLTNLQPGTTYHYKVGVSGVDQTFKTAPTGDFTWDDIGDTGTSFYDSSTPSSCNKFWMPNTWQQVAADSPDFVFHGGDISYANECGEAAVHAFWNDIGPVASKAPIQFSWGNHEYGSVNTATAPTGTPRDSMANYKGRYRMSNSQTVPINTSTRTSNPGCPSPGDASQNGCLGNDWGYFTIGHVLFIGAPEPWVNAYADWQSKADALMAAAQADPNIYFVVTQGHRPAYSSISTNGGQADYRAAVNALGDKYSPAARPDGKYVLNVGHHVHGAEVFSPQHGVVQVTNGGGGTKLASLKSLSSGSLWKQDHFGHMRTTVSDDTMKLEFICGQVFPLDVGSDPCTTGSVIYTTTLKGYKAAPPTAKLVATVTDNRSQMLIGDNITYTVSVTNPVGGTTASVNSLSVTLPGSVNPTSVDGGTQTDNTITWAASDLEGGSTVTKTVQATLASGTVGAVLTTQVAAYSASDVCASAGSVCTNSDTTTIASPVTELLTNGSFETDLSGWTVYNTSSALTRTTAYAYVGAAGIRVAPTAGATAGFSSRLQNINSSTGKVYRLTGWLRSYGAGETIRVQVKEVKSDGSQVGVNTGLVTSNGAWQSIQIDYTAVGTGNKLLVNIYGSTMTTSEWFVVDAVSLVAR